jgi:hypothetical protein
MDSAIHLSPKRSAVTLALVALVLGLLSVGSSYLSFLRVDDPLLGKISGSLIRLLWLDEECNIPSWYSASLLLICSFLLAFIGSAHREPQDGHRRHWLLLAFIFVFLSLDETAQLHELSIAPLRDRYATTGLLYYPWIVPAGLCVLVFVASYLRFLSRLPQKTRRLFWLAGGIYVGATLGVEAISGTQASLHGEHTVAYHAITTVEELLEMTGLIVFIYALLDYIGRQFPSLRVHVASR